MNTDPNEHQPGKDKPHLDTAWSPVADAMRHNRQIPVTKQGNPIDPADPGTPNSKLLVTIFTVLIVGITIIWQNSSEDSKFRYLFQKPPEPMVQHWDHPAPGGFGQVDLLGRFFVRAFQSFQSISVMSQLDPPNSNLIDEDEVRLIMLAGEFEGDEEAIDRLNALKTELFSDFFDTDNTPHPDPDRSDDLILAELNALETIYTVGIDALNDHQREQLAKRYGLIGKLALTHGLDDDDPRREPLIDGWFPILIFSLIVLLAVPTLLLGGLVVLCFGVVRLASGQIKLRNHVPVKGGSVFLETYTLFVGGFLLMSVSSFLFPQIGSVSIFLPWLLLLTILWGIFRGMHIGTWKKAIGWHTGEGILKEISCGLIAYIATIPLLLLGSIITLLLLTIKEKIQSGLNPGDPVEPVAITNEIFQSIASGNIVAIVFLFSLVTIWAPIMEESIFRGALFRHLRGSMHWVFAALASAALFAFMHNYGPLMVTPILMLGFMFAFMREWRGSLIAPMTAHFLHNFTVMSLTIILVLLIKDPI
jgi:membrane protease YdiL (CAAX protease family)